MDQQVAEASLEQRQVQQTIDDLKRKVADQDSMIKAKEQKIVEVTTDLQANEADYFSKIKDLQTSLGTIRSESMQAQQMFTAQLESLKSRLIAEKKGTGKEIDQSL